MGLHCTFATVARNVTTAGTRVRLSVASLSVREAVIQAKGANTGTIYLGGADVASTNGFQLTAGQSFSISGLFMPRGGTMIDLTDVWIDASVSGEGVIITYLTGR